MRKKSSTRKKTLAQEDKRTKPRPSPAARWLSASDLSDEAYAKYLERYEMYGNERPRLNHSEFNRLDDELWDLLAEVKEGLLDDDQTIRLQELEFLLLDEQSDSSPF